MGEGITVVETAKENGLNPSSYLEYLDHADKAAVDSLLLHGEAVQAALRLRSHT